MPDCALAADAGDLDIEAAIRIRASPPSIVLCGQRTTEFNRGKSNRAKNAWLSSRTAGSWLSEFCVPNHERKKDKEGIFTDPAGGTPQKLTVRCSGLPPAAAALVSVILGSAELRALLYILPGRQHHCPTLLELYYCTDDRGLSNIAVARQKN
jgi:hypothetical protein